METETQTLDVPEETVEEATEVAPEAPVEEAVEPVA